MNTKDCLMVNDMKKILLISNMYPSSKYPGYGIFVKKSEEILSNKYKIVKSVMYKSDNMIKKIISYLIFYTKTILKGMFVNYNYIYGHYISHIALPILFIHFFRPRKKIILNVHGNDIVPENRKDEKMKKWSKRVIKIADKIISPSKYFKNVLVNEYKVEPEKIIIFPSAGIDNKIFKKINKNYSLKKCRLNSKYRYIGYVSRIDTNKGWDIFIEAARMIKKIYNFDNVKFLMIGYGNEIEKLHSLIAKYDLKKDVIYLDNVPHNDLVYYYNCMELFVFPTYRKSESLGLVGLEAMACEVPVIASDKYGPTSYINDQKNGFLFKTNNSKSLTNSIINVLGLTQSEIEKIKKNALQTAESYYTINISDILTDIFEK